MAETRYNVVYRGKILQSFDIDAAKRKLIASFSISEEQADRILKSRRAVLKKDVDEAVAKKFGGALKRAGLDIVLTRSTAGAVVQKQVSAPAPKPPGKVFDPTPETSAENRDASAEQAVVEKEIIPASVSSRIPLEFHGTGIEYFKIWIVNIILSMVTLGIYSAWGKVRRKQYLYGSARIKAAGFEYLADPKKILKGRTIVAAVFIIYSIVSNLIPAAGVLLSLAFVLILPWLVVRSLAFNARNSAYRNIRFGFEGSVKEAAQVYILWPLAATLTLGALSPYVYFRQKKFIVENSRYGRTKFSFSATARDYYGVCLAALVPFIIGLLAIAASGFLFPPLIALIALVLYLYLFAFFSVKTTNLLYNASTLAAHRFEAELKVGEYIVLVLTNSLATALTLGLFHPWAKIRALRYKLGHITLVASGDIEGFVAGEQKQVSAIGDEVSDLFDMDFGL